MLLLLKRPSIMTSLAFWLHCSAQSCLKTASTSSIHQSRSFSYKGLLMNSASDTLSASDSGTKSEHGKNHSVALENKATTLATDQLKITPAKQNLVRNTQAYDPKLPRTAISRATQGPSYSRSAAKSILEASVADGYSRFTGPDVHYHRNSVPSVFTGVSELRELRRVATRQGKSIGFVPTMGALHEGHLDLMRAAAVKCQDVWVSIYVNPTQFGINEDLSSYPSTWEADLAKIKELNNELTKHGKARVSTIFRPNTPEVLYPYGVEATSHVIINPELTQILEGSSRPTFFRGVTTVVMKLLNIVQPEMVFFGQKDIQQFAVIKRMIKEFHLPVKIERVSTTREASGLAMSSRNAYLGERRLKAASLLSKMLFAAKATFYSLLPEQRTREALLNSAMSVYNQAKINQEIKESLIPEEYVNFRLDYLSLADPDTLQEINDKVGLNGAVMSLAVYFEPLKKDSIQQDEILGINQDTTTVRLIDNELFGVPEDEINSSPA